MNKYDWTMSDWRKYYEGLRRKAEDNYQETGESRYEREEWKWRKITEAFDGYIEHKNEADTAKVRRQNNIDAYVDRYITKNDFTRDEVMKFINTIRDF